MLALIRDVRTETAVLGRLYLGSDFLCYTLENASKAIPAGLYSVQNSVSPKFKRELPLVYNSTTVKAERGIRIHRGNYAKDSAGCILVGMGRDVKKGTITESTPAETTATMICRFQELLAILELKDF